MKHRTKVVATVGPACDTYEKLLDLVNSGVNVFRLNFSHGTHEGHEKVIQHIRKINASFPFNIAILADLQGPKLRVGEVEKNAIDLKEGDIITFTNKKSDTPCTKDNLFISYPQFSKDVRINEKILLDDGKIETQVVEIAADGNVHARVISGGVLSSRKGVNLPDTQISIPSLTEKDLADLDFIIDQGIDWVSLSFVRKAEDIANLRAKLHAKHSNAKICAKIEKPEAVKNMTDIIRITDAVMVARGDLGVEVPIEKVPGIQKEIVRKCIHRAKPVIIATQMMESMIDRTKPNRSEVTDVANAVMEGADAVMLSAETAMGQHPSLVVKTMVSIIEETEKESTVYNRNMVPQKHSPTFLSDVLCYDACKIAEDLNADALIGMTQSGYTGFMLSSYRPKSPLYVFTKTQSLVNQLSLSWGVEAFFYNIEKDDIDKMFEDMYHILKQKGLLKPFDVVVNTGSTPVKDTLPTNLLKITKIK